MTYRRQRELTKELLEHLRANLPCAYPVRLGPKLPYDGDCWAKYKLVTPAKGSPYYLLRLVDFADIPVSDLITAVIYDSIEHEYSHARADVLRVVAGIEDHGPHYAIERSLVHQHLLGLRDQADV